MNSKLFDPSGRLKVSASQIKSFLGCPMFWYLNKVKGHPTKVTPALAYGKKFHSCVERSHELVDAGATKQTLHKLLLKEKKFTPEHIDMVTKGWEKKILVKTRKKLVEKSIKIPVADYGIMRGFIDLFNVGKGQIIDHKTIGDWKWSLKQEDLREDLQLMIYAYWAFNKLKSRQEIVLRHNQFFKPDPFQSQYIEDVVDRDYAFDYWAEHVEKPVAEMVCLAGEEDVPWETEVEKNLDYCGAYGGCCYKGNKCTGKK